MRDFATRRDLYFSRRDWDFLRFWIARPRLGPHSGFAKNRDCETFGNAKKRETAKPRKLD